MEKIHLTQILVDDAELNAITLNEESVTKLIDETQQKQEEILKLKEVNQEALKMVVEL